MQGAKTKEAFQFLTTVDSARLPKTPSELIAELESAGFSVDSVTKSCIEKLAEVLGGARDVLDLVRVTNIELGFRDGARIAETYARAGELGLTCCPQWVGPLLRMDQGFAQQRDERLHVAMEPICDGNGRLSLFKVSHIHYGCLLAADDGELRDWYPGDTRWVFADKRSTVTHGRAVC